MRESSLKKRYFIKLLASIVNGVIGIIIVAIVPKAIGPVAYGEFVYLQQFFTKVIGFLDSGSSIAFFTKLSAKSERKDLISFYLLYSLLVVFILNFSFFVIGEFEFTSYLLPNINDDYIYWGIGFVFLTWFSQFFIKISDAYALTVSVEIIKIIHKALSLCLLVYFIYFMAFDLIRFYYFNIISLVTFIGWLLYLFLEKGLFSRNILLFHDVRLKALSLEFVTYCSPLFVYSLAGLFFGLFDIWLLQAMSGSIQTGYYGLAYSIAAMCFIFTGAMTPIITREFSLSYEKNDLQSMRKLFERYIPMLYSIAAYFAIFISIQSDNVLAIFTDEKFLDAYWVLVIMALYPIHQTYGQISGSIFYATGQTRLYRNIGVISMLIGVILTLIFVYVLDLSALGLAVKMIISQIIGVNIQLYFNMKLLKLNIKKFIWHQMYSVVFFAVAANLSIMLIDFSSPIISFLVSGFIYTFIVVLGLIIYPKLFSFTKEEINQYVALVKRSMRI